jgi:hypothetical protein
MKGKACRLRCIAHRIERGLPRLLAIRPGADHSGKALPCQRGELFGLHLRRDRKIGVNLVKFHYA